MLFFYSSGSQTLHGRPTFDNEKKLPISLLPGPPLGVTGSKGIYDPGPRPGGWGLMHRSWLNSVWERRAVLLCANGTCVVFVLWPWSCLGSSCVSKTHGGPGFCIAFLKHWFYISTVKHYSISLHHSVKTILYLISSELSFKTFKHV